MSGLSGVEHDTPELSVGQASPGQECESGDGQEETFHVWAPLRLRLVTVKLQLTLVRELLRVPFGRFDGIRFLLTFAADLDRCA
jgi:hypothetical protein